MALSSTAWIAIVVVIVLVLLAAVGFCFIKYRCNLCKERKGRIPEDQVLNLQSDTGGDLTNPQPLKWEDARSIIRSFLRDKESEYQTWKSRSQRFIYIATDQGHNSTAGHFVLKSYIENFFYDNGYRYSNLNAQMIKVDLEKRRLEPAAAAI